MNVIANVDIKKVHEYWKKNSDEEIKLYEEIWEHETFAPYEKNFIQELKNRVNFLFLARKILINTFKLQ